MSPEDAVRDINLGRFAELDERGRIAQNVLAVYYELDPTLERVDPREVFRRIAALEGSPTEYHDQGQPQDRPTNHLSTGIKDAPEGSADRPDTRIGEFHWHARREVPPVHAVPRKARTTRPPPPLHQPLTSLQTLDNVWGAQGAQIQGLKSKEQSSQIVITKL